MPKKGSKMGSRHARNKKLNQDVITKEEPDLVGNRAPRGDKDCIDFIPAGSCMMPGFEIETSRKKAKQEPVGAKSVNGHKLPKRKRRGNLTAGDEATGAKSAKDDKSMWMDSLSDKASLAGPDGGLGGAAARQEKTLAPQQKPGESARNYSRRVDEWTRKQLTSVTRKASTDNARERRKLMRDQRKERLAKRRKTDLVEEDELFRRAEPVPFGEVVQRPPILDKATMRARAKLKGLSALDDNAAAAASRTPGSMSEQTAAAVRLKNAASSFGSDVGGKSAGGDFAAMAARVSDAYAAMKKKRRLAAAGAK